MDLNVLLKEDKADIGYDKEVESINLTAYIDYCLHRKILVKDEYYFLKKIFKSKSKTQVYNILYAKHECLHFVWNLMKYKLNQFRLNRELKKHNASKQLESMPKKRKRDEQNAICMQLGLKKNTF